MGGCDVIVCDVGTLNWPSPAPPAGELTRLGRPWLPGFGLLVSTGSNEQFQFRHLKEFDVFDKSDYVDKVEC